ncbi:16S rRNA (adenine(1518)-N(6)/adenine(1519)-N(6))-dimethyltransferase RsmA [Alloscardovia theropitheci]|uniref:Ribosomal RNA small subunit methyltransferase A n=1 Tax=Alloscardovia theropitheci TaxID=2496842 RepID=A0A4V2MTY7_9BIFI|nr:16S rRNA (adenine(1518)-N(6)/adenine(1519)-N(6))-dimethyltransferase RsmA [Alloscardovia theropitheci]TCD54279.1 16S rRNA (adenine(1518)-N(6)/adenine(1519)-N(6))-dimethyltransferase RsmA [Alloscardovia theropitheci]
MTAEQIRNDGLLGASDIRTIAAAAGISPTKKFGQNFVIDPGTVRKIVRTAGVTHESHVLEVGPGLGSLTLGLLETGAQVTAIEIDTPVAQQLPHTIAQYMPDAVNRFRVIEMDALKATPENTDLSSDETLTLVANLPYNVATPIILTLLERFPHITSFVVMVQKEVADRLSAKPGNKVYGVPSVKLAWYGTASPAGVIGRNVFWPAPHVDSALVEFHRYDEKRYINDEELRTQVFELIDAAFSQRRKTLRAVLKKIVSADAFERSGIDSSRRGETLTIEEFITLAQALNQTQATPHIDK